MKIAIVGSRNITVDNLSSYVSLKDEIVSGGAVGVDQCAAKFARENGIKLTEFMPEYNIYGRAAPIIRNKKIVDYADKIIVFWDGKSKGTLSVIQYAKKIGKECDIVVREL
jgi:predicted Rossmann fold nucleotide-binding protein DprA/Smf involved in DNA uptake